MDDEHKGLSELVDGLLINFVDEDKQFNDIYQTHEQKIRDRQITTLLKKYVEAYSNKINIQKTYRQCLFYGACGIVVAFSVVIIVAVISAMTGAINIAKIPGAISIITTCVTLLTAILGLVTIITKYCFPENDEEYITRIVKSIQDNDLENKKENIRSAKKDTTDG